MLIETAGGSEYTATECESWMARAGFQNIRVELLQDVLLIGSPCHPCGCISGYSEGPAGCGAGLSVGRLSAPGAPDDSLAVMNRKVSLAILSAIRRQVVTLAGSTAGGFCNALWGTGSRRSGLLV
jgi:hypothetical protein